MQLEVVASLLQKAAANKFQGLYETCTPLLCSSIQHQWHSTSSSSHSLNHTPSQAQQNDILPQKFKNKQLVSWWGKYTSASQENSVRHLNARGQRHYNSSSQSQQQQTQGDESGGSKQTKEALDTMFGDHVPEELTPPQQVIQTGVDFSYLFTSSKPADLSPPDIYRQFTISKPLIPEAFDDFYKRVWEKKEAADSPEDVMWRDMGKPRHGCLSLQLEMLYSHGKSILYRPIVRQIQSLLENGGDSGDAPRQIYLDGVHGCGKSLILTALAQIYRDKGWLVLYVPDAGKMTGGGLFSKNAVTGLWDTPWVAKSTLKAFLTAHGKMLKEVKCYVGKKEYGLNLYDLCDTGYKTERHDHACGAVVRLVEELKVRNNHKCLILIDNYNALHFQTQYGIWVDHNRRRQEIFPWQLTVARAFRTLEDPSPGSVISICAPTYVRLSSHVEKTEQTYAPRDTSVTLAQSAKRIMVPQLDLYEIQALLDYYAYSGVVSLLPAWEGVLRVAQITDRNGFQIRQLCHVLVEDYGQWLTPVDPDRFKRLVRRYQEAAGQDVEGGSGQGGGQQWEMSQSAFEAFKGGVPYRGWRQVSRGGQELMERVDVPVNLYGEQVELLPYDAPHPYQLQTE